MSTFCTFETEYRLTRIDPSFRHLALRCIGYNSRMGEFVGAAICRRGRHLECRSRGWAEKDVLPQIYCQSRQDYYDQRAASPVEDRLQRASATSATCGGGISSRAMLVDTEVATTEREVVMES